MPKLLDEKILTQIKEIFSAQLKQPVEVLFFGQKQDCEFCDVTHQLLEEVKSTSDKLTLSSYDLNENPEVAQKYLIDKAPTLVLAARDGEQIIDYGIRLAGIPSGHEFSSLIQTIILVSMRDSGLNSQTREALKCLDKPVHLQVFVTPT
jgi:glutaredoxin-like protein